MLLALSDDVDFRYTEAEARMIAKLAEVRVRADMGDKRAKAQIAALKRKVKILAAQAKRSPKAARELAVLTASGILEQSQRFAME